MLFMTVPTAGNRYQMLNDLIDASGLPRAQVVIVATKSNISLPHGVTLVEDTASPNIQRWWNAGIKAAIANGASEIAVVNDDVRISRHTLAALHSALIKTNAAIASPSRKPFRDGLHRRPLVPYEPRLWGSLWMLRAASGLRPDERYVWWYGDNDLDIRARTTFGGVVLVDTDFEHLHPSEGTASSPTLIAQTDLDAQTFERQYARLLRFSRLLTRARAKLSIRQQVTDAAR